MRFLKKNPPAIVLGMEISGLAIARSLGKYKIPVIAVDSSEYKIGSLSKYCDHRIICPDPRKYESEFIESLVKLSEKIGMKGVLFPTADDFVLSMSKNREILGQYYILSLPKEGIIENINDKFNLFKLALKYGIAVPNTYNAEESESLIRISEQINYPCIIKPRFGYLLKVLKVKAIKCNGKEELLDNVRKIRTLTKQIIIQEIIPGADNQNFSMCSYFDENSEPLAIFTTRKIRQRPIGFGVGTLVGSCYEPEIVELGSALLKKLRYRGISEIEFKRDVRDRSFKVIEINTRPWDQIGLATRSGLNIPLIAYRDSIGLKQERITSFHNNVKWLKPAHDFYTVFARDGYISRGELRFLEWIESLKGERAYTVFAWDDPQPFLASVPEDIKYLLRKLLKAMLLK